MEASKVAGSASPWLMGGSILFDTLSSIAKRRQERDQYNKQMEMQRRDNQHKALANMNNVANMYTRLG